MSITVIEFNDLSLSSHYHDGIQSVSDALLILLFTSSL